MSDVFLSYSHRSHRDAEMLRRELDRLGVSIWTGRDIRLGDRWREQMSQAIREAHAIVFLVDANALASPAVQREYMEALQHSWSDENKILIPY